MDLGPHAGFILAAYLLTATILGALVVRAVVDHRAQRRALASLEDRGLGRRPDKASSALRGALGGQVPGPR